MSHSPGTLQVKINVYIQHPENVQSSTLHATRFSVKEKICDVAHVELFFLVVQLRGNYLDLKKDERTY